MESLFIVQHPSILKYFSILTYAIFKSIELLKTSIKWSSIRECSRKRFEKFNKIGEFIDELIKTIKYEFNEIIIGRLYYKRRMLTFPELDLKDKYT